MKLDKYIQQQLREHRKYVDSFESVKFPFSHWKHPKINKSLAFIDVQILIRKDEEKRIKSILKKVGNHIKHNLDLYGDSNS